MAKKRSSGCWSNSVPTERLRATAGGRRFTAWPGIAIRVLIELGADKKAKTAYGWTPLHTAAQYGQEAAVRVLIELGADKEAKTAYGSIPLHIAARHGRKGWPKRAVRMLVELGADKEAKDKDNRTPLHVAARFGKEAVNYTDAGKTLGGVRG
jgi:hypothetical protein